MSTMTSSRTAGRPGGGGFRGAVAFEWTKLATVRSTWWCFLAAFLLTGAFAAILGASVKASEENGHDAAAPAPHATVDTVLLAQLAIIVIATLVITSEYTSGSIVTTLQSVPRRGRMLAAKLSVVTLATFVTGVLLSGVATLVAAPLMDQYGEYTGGEAVKTALGMGTYLAVLTVLSMCLGVILRSAAGTITSMIMLLLALPQLIMVIGTDWLETVADYLPSDAGMVIMKQEDGPYSVGVALLVLSLWALGLAVAAFTALRRRDA